MKKLFREIIEHFNIPGRFIGYTEISTGNINQTYRLHVCSDCDEYYMAQRINTFVFKRPAVMMDNICRVTDHLQKKLQQDGCADAHRRALQFLRTRDGLPYVENEGGFWRVYRYISHAHTYDFISDAAYFSQAGRAFGEFQQRLSDFPAGSLVETIPHFHDTPKRMQDLQKAIEENKAGRVSEVRPEIDFILNRQQQAGIIVEALQNKLIPYRVTHNDTKINNVLFDDTTDEPICVIDLDTVMPGSSLYDYGDAIRSGSNAAGEDEEDLSLVRFDLPLFEAFTRGFLDKAGSQLTAQEIALFPMAARILTLELCARFLTDYLNGDVYFKVKKPGHNLIRTRNQIELLRQMEELTPQMEKIVSEYLV